MPDPEVLFRCARRAGHPSSREQSRPRMEQAIRLLRSCFRQRFVLRNNERKRPVAAMLDEASPGPSAHTWTRRAFFPYCSERLRIPEGDCLFGPQIDAQQRALRAFQQRFIESHLFEAAAARFVNEEIDNFKERHCKIGGVLRSISPLGPSSPAHFRTMAKPALGKGLGALINTRVAAPAPVEELGERIQTLPLDQITPSPLQPRQEFRSEHLQELVESIRERGIIQPLIVREVDEKYELIAESAGGAPPANFACQKPGHRPQGQRQRGARTGTD